MKAYDLAMQVTDAMVEAAIRAYRALPVAPETLQMDGILMRDAIQAALDASPDLAQTQEQPACGDHCADVERERDEYRVELDQLRHEKADREAVREGRGPGVPGAMHLEAFGAAIADAFGDIPYHVGSSATQKTGWRDVDVRLILDDDRFDALFPGFQAANHIDAWWALLCAALSELGRARTGLPIDFQIQSMTEANERYPGVRHPLFLIRAQEDHRPVMTPLAVATPEALGSFTAPLDGSYDPLKLVGVGSIAAHLGVSFTQVDIWTHQGSAIRFPEPFTWTTFGPRWQLGVIDQWYELWKASNSG